MTSRESGRGYEKTHPSYWQNTKFNFLAKAVYLPFDR
jgi:hypothetical protein